MKIIVLTISVRSISIQYMYRQKIIKKTTYVYNTVSKIMTQKLFKNSLILQEYKIVQ
jgi:hypothetical protein